MMILKISKKKKINFKLEDGKISTKRTSLSQQTNPTQARLVGI